MASRDLALLSLAGLSVGDAFGETFFSRRWPMDLFARTRTLAPGPWHWTDDTAMAISVVEELVRHGTIDGDRLARRFARRHATEPMRGYGAGAHQILASIARGEDWRTAAPQLFGGQGSFGNGAAMRAAPIGAFFATNLESAAVEAERSASVTHAHSEGIAGAIAVATAAGAAWQLREAPWDREAFFARILRHVPDGPTRRGIVVAQGLSEGTSALEAATILGNGARVSAADTVPFAVWCVAEGLEGFEETLWMTASADGDMDTNCAIVGGIVVMRCGVGAIPATWLERREPLPQLDLPEV